MQKVIVILGQTATGKSDLAVQIAKQVGGEIISADSRQVYTDLDIGSGKITKKEMSGIPHYLLNVANPKRKFTVTQYKKLADKKIEEILKRNKVPIICGGTGFYIDAVVHNMILPEVKPNIKLRKELEKKSETELFKILKNLDAERAKTIDAKNKVRLVRAIEIAQALGKVPMLKKAPIKYEFIKIGLCAPTDILSKRIEKRLLSRIKTGMLLEAKKLHRKGISWKRMEELGLEYRFMALHLQGKITEKEMIEKLQTAIIQYAKRQMTWFKKDNEIKWYTLDQIKKIKI
ncbi:MAG: tRNA (adenosine(37)-N6)-dimethylallyltransferase MiaA [Patescibacteria group bacterium]